MNLLFFASENQNRVLLLTNFLKNHPVLKIHPPNIIFAPLSPKQPHLFVEKNIIEHLPEIIIIEHTPEFNAACFNALFKALQAHIPLSLPYIYLISTADLFFSRFGSMLKSAVFHLPENRMIPFENAGIPEERLTKKLSFPFFKHRKKNITSIFSKKKPPAPENVENPQIEANAELWRFLKIEFKNKFYFHHIELTDIDATNEYANEVFRVKLADPLLQLSMSEFFYEKLPQANLFSTEFLPVQLNANPGIFDLCRRIIRKDGISEKVLSADKKNLYDCPDVFDIIGIHPDISIFRFFDDTKDLKLSTEEIEIINGCRHFPEISGNENETSSLKFQYMSLLQQQRELEGNTKNRMLADKLFLQESEIIGKGKDTLKLLNGLYGSMKIFERDDIEFYKDPPPGTVLVICYDIKAARDIVQAIGKTKDFIFLDMSEFTDLESLATFAIKSYEVYLGTTILTNRESYQKMRTDLNGFTRQINTSLQKLNDTYQNHQNKDTYEEARTFKNESSQCLINMFSSCMRRFLTVNAEKVKKAKVAFTEKKRFERLKDTTRPGIFFCSSDFISLCLIQSLGEILPNFGGIGSYKRIEEKPPGKNNELAGLPPKEIFKGMIQNKLALIGPPLSLRYLIIQDDIHIVKLILEVLKNHVDPFLPVISLVEGIIEKKDLEFFKQNRYPIIYAGCYLFENRESFEEKLHSAFNTYIPI